MYIIWFLFAIFLIFLTGNAVLKVIDAGQLYKGWLERAVISYPLGILSVSIMQLYALYAKTPLNKNSILLLTAPFFIIHIYYFFRSGYFLTLRIPSPYKVKPFFTKPMILSEKLNMSEWALLAYMFSLCIIVLFACILMPQYSWDARGVWAYCAKILFYKQTIFTEDFLDPYRFTFHHNYPLLIPLAQNLFFNILGKADDYLSKVIFALFYIDFLFLLYIAQRRLFSLTRMHSLVFTTISISIPFSITQMNGSVPSGCADFPLACFYTLTVIYLFSYMQKRNIRYIILAALFATCCLFTKNEGIPLFLISIFILLADGILGKYLLNKTNIRAFLIYVLLPILILLPWFLIRSKLPTVNDNNPLSYLNISNLMRSSGYLWPVIKYTLREMFMRYNYWGLTWIMVIIALMLNFKKPTNVYNPRLEIYLLITPIIYYFFVLTPIYVAYIPNVSPLDSEFTGMFGGKSFERLRLHVLPLLLLFLSLRVERLFLTEEG